MEITLEQIEAAHQFLGKHLPPTPLLRNDWLSESMGCQVYLKLENMTPIGAFKIRGAAYKISRLPPEAKTKGVIAASAGNHAQGVAWGARLAGVKALIVMPKNTPLMKVQNTQALGAEVHLEGDHYDEAYAIAKRVEPVTGRTFVHAYQDPDVIAGQGTIGIEILKQLPDVDAVIASIGGGGLLGGIAAAIKTKRPSCKIVGCQALGAPSMVESLRQGKAVKLERVDTFADGIKVLEASSEMLKLLKPYVDYTETADDEEIAAAVLTLLEKAKVVGEGAGALPLAVLEKIKSQFSGKKVVLVVGGGNIDVNLVSRIIDRGLTRAGRRLRVNVLISDKPGSLSQLTSAIAKEGANILQAIHDRNEPKTRIDQTDVNLTLETRGTEHSKKLVEELRKQVLKIEVLD